MSSTLRADKNGQPETESFTCHLLQNQYNASYVCRVPITEIGPDRFEEFPDPLLEGAHAALAHVGDAVESGDGALLDAAGAHPGVEIGFASHAAAQRGQRMPAS